MSIFSTRIRHDENICSVTATSWQLLKTAPGRSHHRELRHCDRSSWFSWMLPNTRIHQCWIHQFDPEAMCQSMPWEQPSSPAPKMAKILSTTRKVLVSVCWDAEGTVYLQKDDTIIGEYYVILLRQLWNYASPPQRNWWNGTYCIRTILQYIIHWFQWMLCVTLLLDW